ncbi:MAG: LysR family transcriptional regulator [Acidiferrobacterales bacterium]
MDLKLSHVRTLQDVIRHGSFTGAARARHLTQPAISLHIRELEAQVGQPLIEKIGKRALATKAATILLQHAGRVFEELNAAKHALQRLEGVVSGPVRLGTGATASIYLLPIVLRDLRLRFPALELVVATGNTKEITQAVIDNELDFGVVTLPVVHRQLHIKPIFSDPLVAIAPPGHPLKQRAPLSPTVLAQQPLILFEPGGNIRKVIDDWFQAKRAIPRVVMELGSAEATKKLVGAGLGLSLISKMAVENECRAGELLEIAIQPRLTRQLGTIHRRDKPMTDPFQIVLSAVARYLLDKRGAGRRKRRRGAAKASTARDARQP